MVESEGGQTMAGNDGSDWLDEALNVDASESSSREKHANMVTEGRESKEVGFSVQFNEAFNEAQEVVACETTVYTHGSL